MFPHRRHQDDDEVPPSSDNVMGDYGSQKDDYGGDYGSKGDYDQQDTQSGYQGRVKKEDYGEDYGGQGDYGTQGVKSGYQGGNTEQEEYGGDYGSKAKYGSQDTDQDASDYGGSKKADYGGDYENQQDAQSGYLQSNTKQQSFTDDTGDYTTTEATTMFGDTNEDEAEAVSKEKVQHGHFEHLAEGGTLAAGAFALYERHEAKKDPEHAGRHRIEEEVAGAAAVGGALFGFHEHHEKKKSEDEEEELEGTKKHGWFG